MPRRRGPYIYRRDGRDGWYAYFSRRDFNVSLGTDDEAEARIAFARELDQRSARRLAPREQAIGDVFKTAYERSVANNTRKTAYEFNLNLVRIKAWLEGRGVHGTSAVNLALVEDYKTARRFTVGAARINRELDSWKKGMRVAVEQGAMTEAALDATFEKLREPRPEPHQRGLMASELRRFLARVDATYRPMLRTVLGSAIRDEEMRHLDDGDLRDGRKPAMVVTPKPAGFCECCPNGWTTKGYRYRTIPVTKVTIAAARKFLAKRGSISLEKKTVWKVIQAGCVAAKVSPFSLHDLRRAWASHMLKAGHPIEDISQWLGHADVLTTMRYLRVVREKMPAPSSLPW